MEIRYDDGIKYNPVRAYALCVFLSVGLHVWLSTFSIEDRTDRKEEIMRVLLKHAPAVSEPAVHPHEASEPLPLPPQPVKQQKPEEKAVVKEAPAKPAPFAESVKTVPVVQENVAPETVKPVQTAPKAIDIPVQRPAEPVKQKPAFDYSGYQNRLGGKLENNKKYPYMARRKGMEGVVQIKAVIGADGSLVSSSVQQSSGFGLLDDEAMRLIRSVFPFEKGSGEQFTIVIPINYRLTE
ncbi:TonB family protein [Seleniivibrio woodruffii]|uniref:TonB family protein n=1 Tax=Seleniivibrio woodruffii TaxID=1078050 RepID=UPI0026EE3FE5|nr:TonB family protein [Seleniivibrio woodruffii]